MAMGGPMRQPAAATTVNRPISGAAPPRPPERKTSSWVMAVLAGLGVLAVIALGVGLALSQNDGEPANQAPAPVAMPDLKGSTEDEATAQLAKVNLKGQAGEPVVDDKCPDTPTVARQDPAANSQVATDRTVTYQLCAKPEQVTVPDLKGSSREAAEAQLRQAGLEPETRSVDSSQPEGQVLEVEKAGQRVDPGTKITLTVSRGNQREVPDVVGKTQAVAEGILQQAGFKVNVDTVPQDGTPGTVVDQDPNAKQTRKEGSTVTIVVIAEQEPEPEPSEEPDPDDTATPPGDGGGTGARDTIGGILRP
jgi:serine/threonine-protein kinase